MLLMEIYMASTERDKERISRYLERMDRKSKGDVKNGDKRKADRKDVH